MPLPFDHNQGNYYQSVLEPQELQKIWHDVFMEEGKISCPSWTNPYAYKGILKCPMWWSGKGDGEDLGSQFTPILNHECSQSDLGLIPLHQPSLLTVACHGGKLEKGVVSILPWVPRGKVEYKSNCSAATRKSLSLVSEEVMVQKILEDWDILLVFCNRVQQPLAS